MNLADYSIETLEKAIQVKKLQERHIALKQTFAEYVRSTAPWLLDDLERTGKALSEAEYELSRLSEFRDTKILGQIKPPR